MFQYRFCPDLMCKLIHHKKSQASQFEIFKEIKSYGHFTWNDYSIKELDATKVEVENLMACVGDQSIPTIDFDRASKMLENNSSLEFLDEGRECPPWRKKSVRGVPSALVLSIAQKRAVDPEGLDFVFGGPTLSILAVRVIPSKIQLIVQRVRGLLSVRKFANYTWRENEIGTQFETLMTDGKLDYKDDSLRHENLTLLQVSDKDCNDKYSILCFAEIDGEILSSSENNKVTTKSFNSSITCEIKTSKPVYWNCKLPLQMISNNSQKLIYGDKEKNEKDKYVLKNIIELDRDDVIGRNHITKIRRKERNILLSLKELKEKSKSLEENKVYLLKFDNKKLILEAAGPEHDDCQIRPDIINALLS